MLPDRRTVLIAGEHEDYYDADFYIYNDVVVLHADGKIDILGYPREVFPPTDFHTATLAGRRIIIIGSLGYPKERKPEITPVAVLDLQTFAISKVATAGVPPGWLHGHSAALSEDGASILIVVRYVAKMHSIQMTVEGGLPQASVQALVCDLVGKMEALENAPYELKQL